MTINPPAPPPPTTTTTTPAPNPPSSLSLSLPPQTFAKLLPLKFLSAHLPSSRPSGRSPNTFRPATLNTGSLTHAHGSAVVRIGQDGGEGAVVVGVRAEVLDGRDVDVDVDIGGGRSERDGDKIARLGLLVPNVEVNTGCHPGCVPGGAPGVMVQGLTHRVITLLKGGDLVGLEELCIYDEDDDRDAGDTDMDTDTDMNEAKDRQETREVKAYFTLYIDIWFLSLSGSAFDLAWLGVLAALGDTRLPAARWDADREGVLCDPRQENSRPLKIRGCPVALSWCVLTGEKRSHRRLMAAAGEEEAVVLLVDPDDFEESCCEEGGVVVVDYDYDYQDGIAQQQREDGERIIRVEKSGGGSFGVGELKTVLDTARQRWVEWKDLLKEI